MLIIIFFITGYVSWTWAELNGAICWDARIESRPLKEGATVCWQPHSTLCDMFVQPFYFISYYFYWIEYDDDDFFFIFKRPIIASWGRDMGTILRPIRISIRIYGWRSDHPVDSIKIGCTSSPTLRPVVSQPLGALNQYRTLKLRISWPWNNTRLISLRNTSNSRQIINNSGKW